MNHPIITLVALFLLMLQVNAQQPSSVPKLINYQGKLTNAEGVALQGQYELEFRLFDATTNGVLVWGEKRMVAVIDGVFNVALGGDGAQAVAGAAVNDIGFAFGAPERFLETRIVAGPGVAAEQILSPRQQMVSVPFAVQAEHAQDAARAELAEVAETLVADLAKALNPPGTIIAYAGVVGTDTGGLIEPVPGYLLCNGAAIDGTAENGKYSALRSALGNAWGNGGNAANAQIVNLPDLRGVFLRGWSGIASDPWVDEDRNNPSLRVARRPGGATGNAVGSFQQDQFESHSHAYTTGSFTPNSGFAVQGGFNSYVTAQTGVAGGSETRGKNAYVVYLIKY